MIIRAALLRRSLQLPRAIRPLELKPVVHGVPLPMNATAAGTDASNASDETASASDASSGASSSEQQPNATEARLTAASIAAHAATDESLSSAGGFPSSSAAGMFIR